MQAGNYVKTYFLEPGEGGAKAYALLRRALQETGRIGIARVALRGRASLAAVRVYKDRCLTMETMHFPDEVRSFAGLQIPADVGYREQELDLARTLISMLAGEFVPGQFEDEYRGALLELIREKVAGEQTYRVEAPAPTGRVVDLMEALRQSVQEAQVAGAGLAAGPGGGAPAPPPH